MNPDPERFSLRNCSRCGAELYRRKGKPTGVCHDCGGERLYEAARASVERAGPTYVKVVRGQLRHWLAEAQRVGVELPATLPRD
jgi:DNA-directed RNA polymerase subunit RPC12/RpoP